jgi:hypothetical protein
MDHPRRIVPLVAALPAALAAAAPAEATLVPGELRFGPTAADPRRGPAAWLRRVGDREPLVKPVWLLPAAQPTAAAAR